MKPTGLLFIFSICLVGCANAYLGDGETPYRLADAETYFKNSFTKYSEPTYDGTGTGHWGHTALGYRMTFRNTFFRADAYRVLGQTSDSLAASLQSRAFDASAWYKTIQDGVSGLPSAKGEMFMPYETSMPEFGSEMLADYSSNNNAVYNTWFIKPNAAGSSAGWITSAFYDHGRALVSLCRAYENGDSSVLSYINDAAIWLKNQNTQARSDGGYVNYFGAGVEGLMRAYKITNNSTFLSIAKGWATDFILNQQNADGSFGGSHDNLARYHGYIMSSLGQMLYSLPPGDPMISSVNSAIASGRNYLKTRTLMSDPDGGEYDWSGICARVWAEMQILANLGLIPAISSSEIQALDNCLDQAIAHVKPENYTGYNRQKACYHAEQVGWVIAVYKYNSLNY